MPLLLTRSKPEGFRSVYLISLLMMNLLLLQQITQFNLSHPPGMYLSPLLIIFIIATLITFYVHELRYRYQKQRGVLLKLVESLAISLDEKDTYSRGHVERVTALSLQLAEILSLPGVDLELLRLSSMLHDIGKVGLPDQVLNKQESLSHDEYELIKQHPDKAVRILMPMSDSSDMKLIIQAVRHHHEWYDGNGYPDGLKADNIPLYSRIIAIADCFDAMTYDRPYRRGVSVSEALEEIEKRSGSQFDPQMVEVFIQQVRQGRAHREQHPDIESG